MKAQSTSSTSSTRRSTRSPRPPSPTTHCFGIPRQGQADRALDGHEHRRAGRPCRGGAGHGRPGPPPHVQHLSSAVSELNLRVIATLRERYGIPIGYSGHETGIASSGCRGRARCVHRRAARHARPLALGSDHAASLEPNGIIRVIRDIRLVEQALGDGAKTVLPSEVPIMQKLRRVGL